MPKSKKVERLFPGDGPVITPDSQMIEALIKLLRQARRSEIKGIGYFYVDGGDSVFTGWCSGCARADYMNSGAATLFYEMMSASNALKFGSD